MKNVNPTKTQAWKNLSEHYKAAKFFKMKNLFDQDEQRSKKFSLEWEDFYVDLGKNIITEKTQDLLLDLADEVDLKTAIESYFKGEKINKTEGRAVLHTALRAEKDDEIEVGGKNVAPEIFEVKNRVSKFTDEIIGGSRRGYTGKAFTDIVNIGIGGSDLGPHMVVESLQYYKNHLETHFISNIDGDHVWETLKSLNPETTLVIVVSKSFSTLETLSNATTAKKWFTKQAPMEAVSKHFVAVSSNVGRVEEFGIEKENIFPMWDWVGGRFSLWSAVGLSIALAVGFGNFESLLKGAHSMDQHFRNTEFKNNIPVQLALLSVWYNNFFMAESEAVIPYTQYLQKLPSYLQQAVMESNGKSVDRNGEEINYQTGNIIWGEPGTNSQHAFFQLIHQGTKLIPADFIGFCEALHGEKEHHDKLMANFFAQTEALLIGKDYGEVENELSLKGLEKREIKELAPFKVFKGNKPTNSILIQKLTPESLGKLIALYEHKIFVQGVIWNIYSYDQWGVELGKQLATNILEDLEYQIVSKKHHVSTNTLIEKYFKS